MKPNLPHDPGDNTNRIPSQHGDDPSKRQRRMYHHRPKHVSLSSTILLSSRRRCTHLLDWLFSQLLTNADLFLLSRSLRLVLLQALIASTCDLCGQLGWLQVDMA